MADVWRDRWCFCCQTLRRFARAEDGRWRCEDCHVEATSAVSVDLRRGERCDQELDVTHG